MEDSWPPAIDFNKFSNGCISGLTIPQINYVMREGEDPIQQHEELDEHLDLLFNDMNNVIPGLADIDIPEEVVNTLNTTESSMKPTSSAKQEKLHTAKLLSFLNEKSIQCDLKTVTE